MARPTASNTREIRAERLGHALRSLAADLAEERRLTAGLRRENAELRAQLAELRSRLATRRS